MRLSKIYIPLFLFFSFGVGAQTISECKARFDKYLNLKGSLNNVVVFEKDAFHILNSKGEKEFSVFGEETKLLANFFENSSLKEQSKLYSEKGTGRFKNRQKDSLLISIDEESKIPPAKQNKPLAGVRIAIDPGHFSSNIIDAKIEGKYIYFPKEQRASKDTVKLVEGHLTFLTAELLKNFLEEQGAIVLLTRPGQNLTAFNMSYEQWYKRRRNMVLDSLYNVGELTAVQTDQFKKLPKDKFFWKFFRDYELIERTSKINAFKPHLSVIIHYNVDDKNSPWDKPSNKNFTMSFIPGAFVVEDVNKINNKLHFVRLLLTNQVEKSKNLSALTINAFINNLKIPPAKLGDADYLTNRCIGVNDGVFSRNLILTRCINSSLVYGESLFQDNVNEINLLSKSDYNIYGIKLPERIHTVARSYYEAILTYFYNY